MDVAPPRKQECPRRTEDEEPSRSVTVDEGTEEQVAERNGAAEGHEPQCRNTTAVLGLESTLELGAHCGRREEVEEAEDESDDEGGNGAANEGEAGECGGEADETNLDHSCAITVREGRSDRESAECGTETPHRIQPLVGCAGLVDAEGQSGDGGEEADIRKGKQRKGREREK